jgi:CRP/FNR family transcriptional regulator, cyclic AMP receptor protein
MFIMAGNTQIYEAGSVIFKEGDKGALMYILVKGCIELRKKVEGGEKVLKIVKTPNEYFGEMSLIDGMPRSATAVASERSSLIPVDDAVFDSMVLSNPKFALTIIKTLSARIRSSNVQISELIETIPRERTARGMVDFALQQGEKIFDGGYKVHIETMRSWVNTHTGITYDDFDACLARFIKNEAIRYAATSAKTREHIVLSEGFVRENNRRDR